MRDMDVQARGGATKALRRRRRNVGTAEHWGSIAAGSALAAYGLSRRRPAGFMVAAVGALLVGRGATGQSRVYEALDLDTSPEASDTRRALGGSAGINVEEAITVNRPVSDLYQFWRGLENLPRFMQHLESVERVTDTISRWRARGPRGAIVEWDAEIINDIPNQLIAWRSLEGADVVSAGSVNFEDGADRGTQIRVRMQYSPPGGKVGAAVAKLLGRDAATEIREDLRRFKQLVEAGEVATTHGQPRGK